MVMVRRQFQQRGNRLVDGHGWWTFLSANQGNHLGELPDYPRANA